MDFLVSLAFLDLWGFGPIVLTRRFFPLCFSCFLVFSGFSTAIKIIFLATLVLGQGKLIGNLEYTLIAFVIIVALSLALETFLGEYLLYRYDHDDRIEESEE